MPRDRPPHRRTRDRFDIWALTGTPGHSGPKSGTANCCKTQGNGTDVTT
jgi:hypothetical protein